MKEQQQQIRTTTTTTSEPQKKFIDWLNSKEGKDAIKAYERQRTEDTAVALMICCVVSRKKKKLQSGTL